MNIAVVGSKGSGKTTFIQTFLGAFSCEDNIAETGVLVFKSTKNPNIEVHEIGMGRMHADLVKPEKPSINFDFIFILIQNDLSIEDIYVIQQLQKLQLSVSVLKTHFDKLAENESNPKATERKLLQSKDALAKKLTQQNLEASVHHIDARNFRDFEFLPALEKLLENLENAEEGKRVSLIQSLQIFENVSICIQPNAYSASFIANYWTRIITTFIYAIFIVFYSV